MLEVLTTDFPMMLSDWGENITIRHKTVQVLDTATGKYTTVSVSTSLQAIIAVLGSRELALKPIKYKIGDLVFRFRGKDMTGDPNIGDTILYATNTYKIVEFSHIQGIYKIIGRK